MMSRVCANSYYAIFVGTTVYANVYVPFPHIYANVYMHDTYTYTYMMSRVCVNSYNAIFIWTTVYAHVYIHFLIYTHTYICMTHILIRIC